jgi:hypothetical protein
VELGQLNQVVSIDEAIGHVYSQRSETALATSVTGLMSP